MNRRIPIRIVRFCRSTWLVETAFMSGLPTTRCFLVPMHAGRLSKTPRTDSRGPWRRALAPSAVGRARPDLWVQRRTSSNWVEFEDRSTLGRFHRIVEIDTVDDADEVDTERNASRERTEHVAEVADALCRV